jgi:hypothetical protein
MGVDLRRDDARVPQQFLNRPDVIPVFQQAAARLEPRVRLAKVNTETEQMLASQFRIDQAPGATNAVRPAAAIDGTGRLIFAWEEDRNVPGLPQIFARRQTRPCGRHDQPRRSIV